jgi:AraC family transcriptional regulator
MTTTPTRGPAPPSSAALSDPTAAQRGPRLLRSSHSLGWDGILVRTFDEPADIEDWVVPPDPDPSLLLIIQGGMLMESRPHHGPWQRFVLQQGDLLLRANRPCPYEVRWRGLAEPIRSIEVHVDRHLVASVAEEVTGRDPARVSLLSPTGFRDPLLSQLTLALSRELNDAAPAGKLYARTAGRLLAVHLLRHYSTPSATPEVVGGPGLSRRQLGRVLDYVRAHLQADLTLEELAAQVGFSAYHFARLFRQATGETPHRFVLRERIRRAKQLLSGTELPLATVALESGFANQSHLTSMFKRHVGRTPRQYRREDVPPPGC